MTDDNTQDLVVQKARVQALTEVKQFESRMLEEISPNEVVSPAIACRPAEGVRKIIFTQDGRYIAAAMGRSIQIWDCQMGKCIQVLTGHTSRILSLVMTADGERLLSSSWRERILWNRKSNQPITVIQTGGLSPLAFLPDENTYLSSVHGSIYFYDLITEKSQRPLHCWGIGNIIDSIAVSADGRRITASSFNARDIAYFNLDMGEKVIILSGHHHSIESLAMTPDGWMLVSGSEDGTLRLWDLDLQRCMGVLVGHYGPVRSVVITPDGKTAVSGSDDRTIRIWDLERRELRQVLMGNSTNVQALAIGPEGQALASGGSDSSVILWDLSTGQPQKTLNGLTRPITCLDQSADELLIACTDHDEKVVRMRKITQGGRCSYSQISLLEHRKNAATAISPDHTMIATGGRKSIYLYDVKSGSLVRELFGHTDFTPGLKFSPDGRWLFSASASLDKTWRIWDVHTGECLRAVDGREEGQIGQYGFGFLPDGQRFLLGGVSDISMWDIATGQHLRKVLKGHDPHMIMALAVHPDGKTFVTGVWDEKIRECDLETGACLRTFEGHQRIISSLAFSQDGRLLISGCEGGLVNYWNYRKGELLATAHNVDQGYLWTTPPDEFAKNGWVHTDRPDLVSLIATDPIGDDLDYIGEDDERFRNYMHIYNDGEMVMNRINDWAHYQELLRLRLGNKEREEFAQIEARVASDRCNYLESGRASEIAEEEA